MIAVSAAVGCAASSPYQRAETLKKGDTSWNIVVSGAYRFRNVGGSVPSINWRRGIKDRVELQAFVGGDGVGFGLKRALFNEGSVLMSVVTRGAFGIVSTSRPSLLVDSTLLLGLPVGKHQWVFSQGLGYTPVVRTDTSSLSLHSSVGFSGAVGTVRFHPEISIAFPIFDPRSIGLRAGIGFGFGRKAREKL